MTNKKESLFRLLRVFIFFIVFLLCFQFISMAFVPKSGNKSSDWTKYTTKAYIGERQNSIDVLLIGNSDLYHGFSPLDCWKQYGFSSCNAGKPSQTPRGAYNALRDALKYQHPKVVALETDLLLIDYIDLGINRFFASEPQSPKPNIRERIKNIDESIEIKLGYYIPKLAKTGYTGFLDKIESAFETAINYYFPLLKYHSRWNSLQAKDFTNMKADWHFEGKGFVASSTAKPYQGSLDYMALNAKKSDALKKNTLKYLNKINELCKQNNIKLVLFSIPCATSWSDSKHKVIADFSNNNKLNYVDLNLKEMNTGINWLTDSNDGGTHMNISGAQKVSEKFGEYLKEHFQLTDHRGDPAFAQWTEDLKHIYN